ncbi:sterile alpha motif domain-containing protein 3-like [Acipenser oxyrinchus oxyrinchus]|uniref:Sterile alpha motif domain-containing protein 3-like n=1 Tax=Acipenser oxyrinchus oxyrinchus TaxID=40147 RepID=A0AAD8G936_ACIOX|nr:sterile alpha motif domain-containing protein 3-like [Acipenser oxyrinchus oxyrinchus]
MVVTNLNKMASQIVALAPKTNLKQMCVKTINSCLNDLEKNGLELTAAILLLPSLFKEDSATLFVIDQPRQPL